MSEPLLVLTSPERVESQCLAALLRERGIGVLAEGSDPADAAAILAVDLPGVDLDAVVTAARDLVGRSLPVAVISDRRLSLEERCGRQVVDSSAAVDAVLLLVRRLVTGEGADAAPATADIGQLTAREREIAELAAHGLRNDEIAQRLAISAHTVRTHLARVQAKLGVQHRVALNARLRRLDTARGRTLAASGST